MERTYRSTTLDIHYVQAGLQRRELTGRERARLQDRRPRRVTVLGIPLLGRGRG